MKKIVLTLGLIALFSCSKDKATEKTEENVQTVVVEREIQLPSRTEKDKKETLKVVFTAKIDKEKDELLSEEVSKNLLEYFELETQEEFDNFLNKKIIEEKFPDLLNASTGKNLMPFYAEEFLLSDCLKACAKEFTREDGSKIYGRGLCKFGCYVDKALSVLPSIK